MNIYISPPNEKLLREYGQDKDHQGNTMSGLINRLLTAHFGVFENTPLPENTEVRNLPREDMQVAMDAVIKKSATAAPKVDDLFRTPGGTPMTENDVRIAESMEQSCCVNPTQPCKHWVWDVQTGEGYKNVLSGRILEVE